MAPKQRAGSRIVDMMLGIPRSRQGPTETPPEQPASGPFWDLGSGLPGALPASPPMEGMRASLGPESRAPDACARRSIARSLLGAGPVSSKQDGVDGIADVTEDAHGSTLCPSQTRVQDEIPMEFKILSSELLCRGTSRLPPPVWCRSAAVARYRVARMRSRVS